MEVLRNIVGVARRRPAKLLYLLTSLGVSFGFIAAVVTIGHASWFRLPSGVADRDYVTIVRRTDSGTESVALVDLDNFRQLAPEVSWFYEMPIHDVRVRDPDGDSRSLAVAGTPDDYFDLLGVAAVRGALVPQIEGGGAVVLSHRTWREIFGADEAVVGTLFDIDGGPPMPIVGVAPSDFTGVGGRWRIGAWLIDPPSVLDMREGESEEEAGVRFGRKPGARVFGVVRDTTDLAGLRSLLDDYRFDAEPVRFEREGPSLPAGVELPEGAIVTSSVVSMDFGIRDSDRLELVAGLETDPDGRREVVQKTTWLSGVVVLLLVMAFVALLEFLLAENVSREDEQNVRIAVGATPMDVFRQSLAENGVWILVIGLVGWFAFRYVVDVLLGIEPFAGYIGETTGLARLVGVGAAALLLVVAFLGCVAYLGWFVSRTTLAQSASRTWTRWGTRQVLAFVGLASLVFVFSLVGRYSGDARMSLGFQNTDVAIVGASSTEWSDTPVDFGVGVEAVESMPGVRSAARARLMPLAHAMNLRFYGVEVLGQPGLDDTPFYQNSVTAGYFATLGVAFLAGRTFEAESENEVVVSRSAAEALGGVDEILGLPLSLSKQDFLRSQVEVVVVGVVEDIAYGDYAVPARRMVYSRQLSASSWQQWVIDTEGDVDAVELLRSMPEFEGWEINDQGTPALLFRGEFLARRSVEIMLSVAAGFALLLALAGMANSMARNIVEDRSAIGIRFALGATGGELGRVYSATRVRDLILAAVLVGAAALVAKLTASAFAAMLELWLLLPALACLVGLVALSGHVIVRRLANRHSVGALVQGLDGGTG